MNMALAGSHISESFGKHECAGIYDAGVLFGFLIKISSWLDVSIEVY